MKRNGRAWENSSGRNYRTTDEDVALALEALGGKSPRATKDIACSGSGSMRLESLAR